MGLVSVDLNPGSIIGALGGLIDDVFTSDEERLAAKAKLLEMEQKGALEGYKTQLSAIIAEAQSQDKWTSRARPLFLYVIYEMIQVAIVGALLSIWFPEHVAQAATSLGTLLDAVPESMWALFGAGYLGYTGARTWEKGKGVTK